MRKSFQTHATFCPVFVRVFFKNTKGDVPCSLVTYEISSPDTCHYSFKCGLDESTCYPKEMISVLKLFSFC